MIFKKRLLPLLLLMAACQSAEKSSPAPADQDEPYRPAFHFTPETGWMNDPNGMIFYNEAFVRLHHPSTRRLPGTKNAIFILRGICMIKIAGYHKKLPEFLFGSHTLQ